MKKLAVAFLIMFFSINTAFAASVKKLKGAPVGVPVYLFDNQIFYAKGACGFLGFSQEPSSAGAKIYDLQTGRVKNLQLNEPAYAYGKRSFVPIKIDDSRVLIIGGNYFNEPTKEADIFDVKTGKFRKIGDTNFHHSKNFTKIIKLDDGEIFILNGQNIEIFDPKTETFIIPSKGHTTKAAGALHKYKGPDYIKGTSKAIKLSDDRIFIIGKTTSNLTKAEIFDTKTNTSVPVDVPNDIPYNACVLLNDDKLLCLPKYFYDIKTGTVSETGHSENFGTITKIIPLANGQILFSSNYNYIRIYDPIKNKFKTLSRRKYFIDGEDLKDGRALLYGYKELYIYKYDK